MKKLPLLLLACIAASAQAAVYQWQDDRGKTQYGDTPPPGVTAEPVDLPPISTVPGQPAAGAAPAAAEATAGDATTGQPYTRIAISSPGNGQTIRTDTGRVDITVSLQPALQEAAGHRLVAVVDGVRIQGSAAGVAILAPRGSHRAQVVVLDSAGKALARSGQIAFDVRPDKRLPVSRELKAITRVQPAN
jgi:hypothetical protein